VELRDLGLAGSVRTTWRRSILSCKEPEIELQPWPSAPLKDWEARGSHTLI
jgi:hypothetical protein